MLRNLIKTSFSVLSKQRVVPIDNAFNLQHVRALPHFVDKPKPGEFYAQLKFSEKL
jgi:hypothetical protein